MTHFGGCLRVFEKPTDEPLVMWAMRNIRTIDDRPFDHFETPYLGAPGGLFEQYTDPEVREIYNQWSPRAAKTVGTIICCIYTSATSPAPIMFTSATKPLVEKVVGERAWKMIELSGLFENIPSEGRRSTTFIRLDRNRWYTGWSESKSSLADKSAKIVVGNELPKWRHLRGTGEAHPWALAKDRCTEYPDRKIIGEGSPSIKGRCLIESNVKTGWNCRLHVPCPQCHTFQALVLGKGDRGGIIAEGLHTGRISPEAAQRTARYACVKCGAELRDNVRPWMMRRGVWVPEGCEVDHDRAAELFDGLEEFQTHHEHPNRPYRWLGWKAAPWVRGTPLRDGPIASSQISQFYNLALGWGYFAHAFARARLKPVEMQAFVNAVLGETWEVHRREQEWEIVLKRLMPEGSHPRGSVPAGFSLLACGIDVQGDHFVWSLVAAGRPRRWAIVDHGEADTLDWIRDNVLLQAWPHVDGGPPLYVRRALIDTGYDPADDGAETVHQWARRATAVARRKRLPQLVRGCKGASTPIGMPYEVRTLGERTACPGAQYVLVDGDFTQPIVDHGLYDAESGGRGSIQIFTADQHEHEDLIVQLMNEYRDEVLDRHNKARFVWTRKDEHIPNDKRDATRYAIVGLLQEIRGGGEVPERIAAAAASAAQQAAAERRQTERPRGLTMPDGRPFFIKNRT